MSGSSLLSTLLPCCFPSARRRRSSPGEAGNDESTPLLNGQRQQGQSSDSRSDDAPQGEATPQAEYDAEVLKHIVSVVQSSFLPLSRPAPGHSGSHAPASNVSAAGGSSSAPQSRDHSVDTAPLDPQAQAITDIYVRALRSKSRPVGSVRIAGSGPAVIVAEASNGQPAQVDTPAKRIHAGTEGSRKSRRISTRPLTLVRSMHFNLPVDAARSNSSAAPAPSSAMPSASTGPASHLTGHRLVDLWDTSSSSRRASQSAATLGPESGAHDSSALDQSTSTLTPAVSAESDKPFSVSTPRSPPTALPDNASPTAGDASGPTPSPLEALETRVLSALRSTEARVGRLHTREEWGRGDWGSSDDDDAAAAAAAAAAASMPALTGVGTNAEGDQSIVLREEGEKGDVPSRKDSSRREREKERERDGDREGGGAVARDLERDKEKVGRRRRNTLVDAEGRTAR